MTKLAKGTRRQAILWLTLLTMLFAPMAIPSQAADRHTGYYYPEVGSSETYRARAVTLPDADRSRRIAFVVAHARMQSQRAYAPLYSMFAKGEEAEKLIIVGFDDDGFATLYRARAMLAQFTALARATKLFHDLAVEDFFTFFDFAKLMGFKQITISDGDQYAHRVILE